MKVKELVKILLECNQELTVYCDLKEQGWVGTVTDVKQGRCFEWPASLEAEVVYIYSHEMFVEEK